MFQAGLNTHREERAGAARGLEGQPRPPALLSGHRHSGCSGGQPLAPQGRLCHQRRTGELLLGPVPPSRSHTSHPSLCKSPPCPTLNPGPAFFPRQDLKATEGQPRGAGCRLPGPRGQSPRPLSSSRPLPRPGPPPSLAAGPPAIIPAPLQRTSCLWVHPHQPGQHIRSLLSPSNGTTGTSRLLLQGTLKCPLGVSEGCLGEASAVHTVYDPATLGM